MWWCLPYHVVWKRAGFPKVLQNFTENEGYRQLLVDASGYSGAKIDIKVGWKLGAPRLDNSLKTKMRRFDTF